MILAAVLFALWFVMSQKTEAKFIIIGIVSSICIAVFCGRTLCITGIKSGRDYYFTGMNFFRILGYFFWLLVQIAKSALYVSRVSLSDRSIVDPSIAWFRADYDSPFARAVLANSITLTPGTITIDITDDGIYSVHALTEELREGLLDGSMQEKVAWAFGEEICFEALEGREIDSYARERKPDDSGRSLTGRRKRS